MFNKNKNLVLEPTRFNPDENFGLTNEQVKNRIEEKLTNSVKKKYSKSFLSIFCGNVFTFFNLLGLIVALALLYIKAPLSRFVFVFVYLCNILIGIVQETRAKICIDKLSLLSNKKFTVLRNGKKRELNSNEIVLDDIYYLGIGNQIPTDSKIVSGYVEVNESLLTGESIPIKKVKGDTILSGSFIVSGVCTAQAINVGQYNYVQTLSEKAKAYKKPHSEIMTSLKIIIKSIGLVIFPVAVAMFVKAYLSDKTVFDFSDSLFHLIDSTSTVVIGMIPSGMFLLTSLALAVGIIKLAQQNTLVQDLYSLEMLARVDTICFDKTGTITDGRMSVKEVVSLSNANHPLNKIISSMLGTLNDSNQTANALVKYFGQNKEFVAKSFLPFNSIRKCSAVTFNDMGTYAFGAPEFVLSKENYKNIESLINQYASLGLRVLILAHSIKEIENDELQGEFIPVALIILVDNIREDAIETIKWFKNNGVDVKVISGDNPVTVSEVSKRVGIDNADRYISLEGLSDNDVFEVANKYTVFGRVSPEQKAILVKALKSAGHVVAMTGDGVNDILAMKESDCAVSVASGSDAARNISNIVLLDNNFNSMPQVVFEGRRVINNVQSSASLFLMKTLFTAILSILTIIIPGYKYPFNLSNMQLLELLVIGVAPFFLSLQPNKEKVSGRFISVVLKRSLPSAILMVLSVLLVSLFQKVIGSLYPQIPEEAYLTMAVYAMTFTGVVNLYMICKPLNAYRAVLFFTIFIIITSISIYYSIFGSTFLSVVKLAPYSEYWQHILIVVAIILLNITLSNNIQKVCNQIWKVKKK